ncbi:MAG: hypothetical protein HY319_10750 [Armatimonadetes bacterium]|nr:hypothetical protein [Armatimonadota bacterium]
MEKPILVPVDGRTETAAFQDLGSVLRAIDHGRVKVAARTRLPTAASRRHLASVLAGGDFYPGTPDGCIKPVGWTMLVQAGGLAIAEPSTLRLTARGRAALGRAPEEVLRELWTSWQANELFDEFSRIEAIHLKGKRSIVRPSTRRRALTTLLLSLSVGAWVEVDEFFARARESGARLEITGDLSRLYAGDPILGSLVFVAEAAWNLVAVRYGLAVLFEILAPMGALEVDYVSPRGARSDFQALFAGEELPFLSRYDGLRRFRLTALGAYCLGVESGYRPPASRAPRVTWSGLELEFSEPPPPGLVTLLGQYARPLSAVRWRLDMTRTLASAERGHPLDALRRALSEPPPEARAFLAEAERRTTALVHRGTAHLFSCESEELARRLAADPATSRWCVLASQGRLVVEERHLERFKESARRLGYAVLPEMA